MKLTLRISLMAAVCLAATVVRGAIVTVELHDYYFIPTNATIKVGDTVRWTNTSFVTHDTTSAAAPPLWSSGNVGFRGTFSFTFTNAGTFPYLCLQHITHDHPEMTGQVLVAAINLGPSVAITNPVNSARFLAPANVLLQVVATNGAGSVTNVQFFQDGVQFASLPFPPYQATTSDLVAGNYTFTARAQDNAGLTSTSAPVGIQVLTNARLSAPIRSSNNFRFTVNAIAGQTYVAEVSTNFANWQPFATNAAAASTFNFTNSAATNSSTYYRVRQDLQ